ncbi:DUF3291 domain-containing protein [Roseibium sp.]|uniref:DUF3291 domain-containing protein n=1 Tax=Roseibium sp. TaxID=1936156 RepID=UPI003A976245
MTGYQLAAYTFGQFLDRADSPRIKGFFDLEPSVVAQLEASPGFIARSGYVGEEGPDSWGIQVFPRFWVDNGDGWAPSTLSLWTDLDHLAAATYHGLHGDAYKRGREWNIPPEDWPGYVLWWAPDGHRPNWREAVERHEHLADHGPTSHAFNFKQPFAPDGKATRLDIKRIKSIAKAVSD